MSWNYNFPKVNEFQQKVVTLSKQFVTLKQNVEIIGGICSFIFCGIKS